MDTFIRITGDLLGCILNLDTLITEKGHSFFKVLFGTGNLNYHDAFFSWKYRCLQDRKCEIKVLGQIANGWL